MGFQVLWPAEVQRVVLFISWCFDRGLAPSTITTYIAGLNFCHKLHGGVDLHNTFMINKLLEGCARLKKKKDVRLPISYNLLKKICGVLHQVCLDEFEVKIFKAAFLLAYFGMFRVSEIVAHSAVLVDRTLKFANVEVTPGAKAVIVVLDVYKMNQHGLPVSMKIPAKVDGSVCPVRANGCPVTRYQFSAVLAKCIRLICPSCSNIKSHSFWIGRATQLAAMGISGEGIKKLGRWSSETYARYIRR